MLDDAHDAEVAISEFREWDAHDAELTIVIELVMLLNMNTEQVVAYDAESTNPAVDDVME